MMKDTPQGQTCQMCEEAGKKIAELERTVANYRNWMSGAKCYTQEELTKLIDQAKAEQREIDIDMCKMFYRDDGTAQQCAEAIRNQK